MSCGGYIMRTPFRPLALLVDDVAERWLLAEEEGGENARTVQAEIAQRFTLGDRAELTFHGERFLLILTKARDGAEFPVDIHVHRIALNN